MEKFDENNSLKGRIIFIDQINMKVYYPDFHFIGFVPDGLGYALFAIGKNKRIDFKSIRPFLVYSETRLKCQCVELWTGEYNEQFIKNLDVKKSIIDGKDYNIKYIGGRYFLISGQYLGNLPIHDSFIDMTNYFQIDKKYLYDFVNNHPKCVSVSKPLNDIDLLKFFLKSYDISKKDFRSITLQTIDISKLECDVETQYLYDKSPIKIESGIIDFLTFERIDDIVFRRQKDTKIISFLNEKENLYTNVVKNWEINFKKFNNWQNLIKQNIWLSIYNVVDNEHNISSKNNTNKKELEIVNSWLNDNTKQFDSKNKLFKIYNDINSNMKESNKKLYNAFERQVNAYRENKLIGLDGKILDSRKKIIVERER